MVINMKKLEKAGGMPTAVSAAVHIFFILFAAACIIPILLVISISLTDESALMIHGYNIIPYKFSGAAYKYVTSNMSALLNAYAITILVTVAGTALSVFVIAMFAYPLSRKNYKYRTFFTFIMFVTIVFNGGMVPWYIVCTQILHIQNTIFALILPYVFNGWYAIILRSFFQQNVPDSLIEAARVDGAHEFKTFLRIVLPLALPGLATVALFQTLAYWNDWWLPLMLTSDQRLQNLQYMLYNILTNIQALAAMTNDAANARVPSEGARMALCILAIGPIILAYPFFQKYFIQGLTVGAVKG